MRLQSVEDGLESLLDGIFGRAFPGKVHPVEILHFLRRALEHGQVVSGEATYVPNRLTVRLHPQDYEALGGLVDRVSRDLERALEIESRKSGWTFGARILVRLQSDESVARGRPAVSARLDEGPLPAQLRFENGPHAGRVVLLAPGMTIGRAPECELHVEDPAVSRRHCTLDWVFVGYQVTDLGSTNGTWVNDVRVSRYVLGDGDILTVGTTRLVFGYRTQEAWSGAE